MPKLAANLKFLFAEFDFSERFSAAARAGFKGVEYQYPYGHDKHLLRQELSENNLEFVLLNLPAGDERAGERGIACLPDRSAEFVIGVEQAIDYATALNCRQVNCLAGIPSASVASHEARDVFVRNLRMAAPRLKAAGIRLLIEAINTRDMPGFFLNTSAQAIEIIEAVESDNLFLQYDIYHMQIMEGDLAPTIAKHLDKIAHMQLADTPGRHEPGTGEINYRFLLDHIDRLGYQGWISCEYQPLGNTLDGLAWARPYLQG